MTQIDYAAQKLSLPPSRPVNMLLGPYEPCFEIGAGGMASVYIARERGASGLRRTVALKVMHEHLARRGDFKSRFLDEARVLTQIAHPYVCRVVGYGEEAGRPFMAMEYLIGEPLSRVLRAMKRRGQSLPTMQRARLFARVVADLAEGLHAAHEARGPEGQPMGVVHRDITPHNLFLLYDGTVRILDFGIARFADRNVQTVSSALLGKLPYMAPEQLQGEGYDRRVDVWALGVVLWELVTLGRLFKRETEMRTMRAVCSDRIPAVGEYAPHALPGLDDVLSIALQRDPNMRYSSARAFSRSLELWLAASGPPVTHADLSEFLGGFFPGSQVERQRWAQHAIPSSGVRRAILADDDDVATPAPDPYAATSPRDSDVFGSSTEPTTPRYGKPGEIAEDDQPTRRYVRDKSSEEITANHLGKRGLREISTGTLRIVPPDPQVHSNTKPSRILVVDEKVPVSSHAFVPRRSSEAVPSRASWLAFGGAFALCLSAIIIAYLGQRHDSPTGSADEIAELTSEAPLPQPASAPEPPPLEPTLHAAPLPVEQSNPPKSDRTPNPGENPPPSPAMLVAQETNKPATSPRAPAPAKAREEQSSTDNTARDSKLDPTPAEGVSTTGDVLIVSSTPGVKVYLGARLLGTTPVKTRLPAGQTRLSVQVGDASERIPMSADIAPGRLNMLSVNVSH